MKFLIQKIGGKIVHDFTFALLQCKDYYHWLGEELILFFNEDINFEKFASEMNPQEWIPVGSVEYVSEYIKKFYPDSVEALRPLNVPEVLFPFADRPMANVYCKDDFHKFTDRIPDFRKTKPDIYCKSLDTIKDPFNGPMYYEYDASDFRHYQVSPVIEIASEWRVFVFRGSLLDCRRYSGDIFAYPDPKEINKMITAYGDKAPVAYTLDVAVTPQRKTVVIECHRFFSCGLYGFSDLQKYPIMLSQAWFEMKNTK